MPPPRGQCGGGGGGHLRQGRGGGGVRPLQKHLHLAHLPPVCAASMSFTGQTVTPLPDHALDLYFKNSIAL